MRNSFQQIKILRVEIAVSADADDAEVADEISAHLTDQGMCSDTSVIFDWRYTQDFLQAPSIKAPEPLEEGEIFKLRPLA